MLKDMIIMRLRNMSLPIFAEYIKDKEIICFGAGKLLHKVCKLAFLEPYVKAVVDNDPKKYGKILMCEGQSFKVVPWGELPKLSFSLEKTVVLISAGISGAGHELYESLLKQGTLDELECFFLSFIFAEPESNETIGHPLDFRLTPKPLIPKYIHYCWFGKAEIPEEQQRFIAGWKDKCPDFEIIRWDESNYDVKKNPYMRKAYEEGRWGFVPDYARKDIIYQYGGVYLDTDVEVIRNLGELLYQKGFAGVQMDKRINLGLGFGGMPGLDIMAEMCDVYKKTEFVFSDGMKMKVGPDYETEVMKAHGYEDGKALQTVADLTIYPVEVMSGTLPFSGKALITDNTFCVHHYAGSWTVGKRRENNQKMANFYRTVVQAEIENELMMKHVNKIVR